MGAFLCTPQKKKWCVWVIAQIYGDELAIFLRSKKRSATTLGGALFVDDDFRVPFIGSVEEHNFYTKRLSYLKAIVGGDKLQDIPLLFDRGSEKLDESITRKTNTCTVSILCSLHLY